MTEHNDRDGHWRLVRDAADAWMAEDTPDRRERFIATFAAALREARTWSDRVLLVGASRYAGLDFALAREEAFARANADVAGGAR